MGLRGEYLHNAKVRMPFIYSLPTATEIGEERGISGKYVTDYKGRDII